MKLVYTYGNHEIYWSKINNSYCLKTDSTNALWSNDMDTLINEIHKREEKKIYQMSIFDMEGVDNEKT